MKDLDTIEFARKICMLSTNTPIANAYDESYGQKENSSKNLYNHFGRPESLLWLIEALSEDTNLISEIVEEIKGVSSAATACKIIRKRIPFDRILELMEV